MRVKGTRHQDAAVAGGETTVAKEQVFEALWMPRWYGQDPALAQGQESVLQFRNPVPPTRGGVVFMAAGLDRPRWDARCRVLGLKHDVLGRIQAIEVSPRESRFVRHDGSVVLVDADGGLLREGLAHPPPDWTVRVVLQVL